MFLFSFFVFSCRLPLFVILALFFPLMLSSFSPPTLQPHPAMICPLATAFLLPRSVLLSHHSYPFHRFVVFLSPLILSHALAPLSPPLVFSHMLLFSSCLICCCYHLLTCSPHFLPSSHSSLCRYAYLDGELHVRVSLAMDAIVSSVAQRRKKTETSLAYLCSPTDVFVVDKEARDAARKNYKAGGSAAMFAKIVRLFVKKVCYL